jgi:pyruvate formate lyase activating enzyme
MLDRERTPELTLTGAREIGISAGIKYCYVGNVHNEKGQTTFCPNCSAELIKRDWHSVKFNRIADSKCPNCRTKIEGVF